MTADISRDPWATLDDLLGVEAVDTVAETVGPVAFYGAGDRERRLTRIAADRALPSDPDGVALVAAAVDRFATTASDLTAARRQERTRAEQAGTAERDLRAAQDNAAELEEDARAAATEHAEQAEGLTTLRASIGADVARVLEEVAASRALTGKQSRARASGTTGSALLCRGAGRGKGTTGR
ncbi:MAG: hypothetical protein LC808_06555 [Actinobacteria bacterium]|nr:hypothetical protein [Actinomycetota bacterium]